MEFRLLALVSALTMIGAFVYQEIGAPFRSSYTNDALGWNYFDALASHEFLTAVHWYTTFATAVGMVGFIFFKPWGRSLILFSYTIGLVATPFSGLSVADPVTNTLLSVGGIVFVYIFAISYFPPCNEYFAFKKPKNNHTRP